MSRAHRPSPAQAATAYVASVYGVQLAISRHLSLDSVVDKVMSADEGERALRASRWFARPVREGVVFSLRPRDAGPLPFPTQMAGRPSFVSVSHTGACVFVDVQLVDALYILELINEVAAAADAAPANGSVNGATSTDGGVLTSPAARDSGNLAAPWSLSTPPEATLHMGAAAPLAAPPDETPRRWRRSGAYSATSAALNHALAFGSDRLGISAPNAALSAGARTGNTSDASLLLLTKARDTLSVLVDPTLPAAADGNIVVNAGASVAGRVERAGLPRDLSHSAAPRQSAGVVGLRPGMSAASSARFSPARPFPQVHLTGAAVPAPATAPEHRQLQLAVRRLDLDAVRAITAALARSLALQRAEQFAERELLPRLPALSAAAENGRILLAPDGTISIGSGGGGSSGGGGRGGATDTVTSSDCYTAAERAAISTAFKRLLSKVRRASAFSGNDSSSIGSGFSTFRGTYATSAALAYSFIASCKRLQTALQAAQVAGPVRPGDAAWGDADLGRLYEALADDLELEARHDALHRRLDYACEVARFAADANWDSRMDFMTWQIIFLLAFSCLLKLVTGG